MNDKWPMRLAGLVVLLFSGWLAMLGDSITRAAVFCGVVGGGSLGGIGLQSRDPLHGWKAWTAGGLLVAILVTLVGWVDFGGPAACGFFGVSLLLLSFREGGGGRTGRFRPRDPQPRGLGARENEEIRAVPLSNSPDSEEPRSTDSEGPRHPQRSED